MHFNTFWESFLVYHAVTSAFRQSSEGVANALRWLCLPIGTGNSGDELTEARSAVGRHNLMYEHSAFVHAKNLAGRFQGTLVSVRSFFYVVGIIANISRILSLTVRFPRLLWVLWVYGAINTQALSAPAYSNTRVLRG